MANGHDIIIGIRDTAKYEKNPFSAKERKEMIKNIYGNKVKTVVIPDIDAVWIGRKVGYQAVQLPEHLERISGTEIRKTMRKNNLL